MYKVLFILVTLIFIVLTGCEKDPQSTETPVVTPPSVTTLTGAFIMNEGLWGSANGSLSFYDAENHLVQNNIFKSINGRTLGDIVQSMAIYDTLGFIVVNTSNKIEVIGLNSWKSVATIEMPAGASPRSMAFYNGKGYVTNLMTNNVSVINLDNYSIEGSIAVGQHPEGILIYDGKAYVANSGFGYDKTVSVIDLAQNTVIKEISVGDNPGFLSLDSDNEINVLCVGRYPAWGDTSDHGSNGSLYVIDPSQDRAVDSLALTGHPTKLTYGGNDTGFFINNGNIVAYSTISNEITNTVLSDSTLSGSFYGLEADPVSQQLFVLTIQSADTPGQLYIYDFNGQLQESYSVGIFPGAVTFITEQK